MKEIVLYLQVAQIIIVPVLTLIFTITALVIRMHLNNNKRDKDNMKKEIQNLLNTQDRDWETCKYKTISFIP